MSKERRHELRELCVTGTHVPAIVVPELMTEICRLRGVLIWYADPLTYLIQQGDTESLINLDMGRNARDALKD